MATPYSIQLAMNQNTVDDLSSGGYQLFAFKGVLTNARGGVPVVWFASSTFGLTTKIKWSEQYQGYTSAAGQISGGAISGANPYDMNLGQTLAVTGRQGTGEVLNGGDPLAITIENKSGVQFTSGISETVEGGGTNPLCAFDLFGAATLQIAPIELVLLMFATNSINTGAVVHNAFTTGVLVNLTADPNRQVQFDINSGWNWGGAGWGQMVTENAPLAPLLIDGSLADASKRMSRAS